MNLNPVISTRMSKVGYEDNTMFVQFKDGSIYAYENVSPSEYDSFIHSPSLGSALSRLDKIHTYHRV